MERPIRKDRYDWRDKVCKSCGVEANNGCCERHTFECKSCNGYGATTEGAYYQLYNQYTELSNNPPNKCCEECTAYFSHRVGSHSDDSDGEPCYCNKNKCNFPLCICHSKDLPRNLNRFNPPLKVNK